MSIVPGYSVLGNIGGRAYQNVTVMYSMLRALRSNVDDLSKELAGAREEYLETMDQYLVPLPEATFWATLPRAIQMMRKRRAGLKNLDDFLAENPRWCQSMSQRIQALQISEVPRVGEAPRASEELASLLLEEMLPHFFKSFWHTVATAWRYAELVGRLRRELTELVGATDADSLLSNVSSQDELLASMGPMVGLARVARGEMSRKGYLEQWGHRGPLETEAYVPRPSEDPDWLDEQLAAYAESPVDVEALLAARRAAFEETWMRFRDHHRRRARSVRRRLEQAAEAARVREAVRSELTRLIGPARCWVLRVGDLTGLGDGAFFLTLDELLALLAGRDAPTHTIPTRRQTYEQYKALPPYPLLIRGRFDPFQWAADPDRRSDVFDSHGLLPELTLKAARENVILGMPGSAGQAEGIVRRLDKPEEGEALQHGEILVTSQTNIGWTPFFPRAAAIVTDVGAPLSHAAIVARELGIPAVVNCANATMRLRTGDRVRVDGGQGTVEILG
jgi:pyruvate,water dikinase